MKRRVFITEAYSSRGVGHGQYPRRRPLASVVPCLLLLSLLCPGGTGCTSIYRRARNELPPEPVAELNLRVADAGQAERLARQAEARLRNDLQRQKPPAVTGIDFDRLEAAAFELERRVLAARDAAERCGRPTDSMAEIERLSRQARAWLDYVQANRGAGPAIQLQRLDGLLR